MAIRLKRGNLQVSEILVNFIEKEALPNTNITSERFWKEFETILDQFVPKNKSLLKVRKEMKQKIDTFYLKNTHFRVVFSKICILLPISFS